MSTTWIYDIPDGFIVTNYGLDKAVESAEDYLEKSSEPQSSNDDVMLLSLVRKDSSDINRVLVSYKSNSNIRNSSLREYAIKLGAFFEESAVDDTVQSETSVGVAEKYIDDILFYCITKKTTFLKNKYTYSSQYYVAEIDDKEFSIVAIFDNEKDRFNIVSSIIHSKFK